MNKILSFSLLFSAALAFTACAGEEDDIFNASAAERLNAASALYSSRLEASPNGWAMQLYPTTKDEYPYGSGYLLLMDFDPDFSVKVAMNNRFSSNTYWEDRSVWEVITDNGPVLSFNSFNKCVHAFSDPEDIPWTGTADEAKNEQSEGCGGDYEFIVVDAPEDASYLMLKGKKRGTYNLLTPLEEGVDYEEYLADVQAFHNKMFPANSPTFDVVHFGDSIYKFEGADDGIPNIYPYDGDAITDERFNPFLITRRGTNYYLRFRDEIVVNDNGEEATVQDFRYDEAQDAFVSVDNEAYFIEGDSPVRFFSEVVSKTGKRWQFARNSEMSDKMVQYYEAVNQGFRSKGYTLTNMSFRYTDNNFSFGIQYRVKTNTMAYYTYNVSFDDEGVTLTDCSPVGTAENVKNVIDGVSDFVNIMTQKFIITPALTAFNLNTIKLTSANDPDFWFVVTLY